MNKTDARKIAETISNNQLHFMFNTAKTNIKDWNIVSNVNKGISKGCAWNILASDFDVAVIYHILAKTNMIREFGEFLPNELKPVKNKKKTKIDFIHQQPIFKTDAE